MNTFSLDAGVADFQEKVIDASRLAPVLVDFWAEWCAPCRTLKPVLEKLAAEYGGRFILAKVDSDQHQELAARYGVRGIPNVKAFVDGEMVDEFTGALPEEQIRAFIDSLLPSPAEPLRIAALEARARGEPAVAVSLLADALQLDPANETVQLDLQSIDMPRPRRPSSMGAAKDTPGAHPASPAQAGVPAQRRPAASRPESTPTQTISMPACNWPTRWRWRMTTARRWSNCSKSCAAIASGRTRRRARSCSICSPCSVPIHSSMIWSANFASSWRGP
jgi:thioredoxin